MDAAAASRPKSIATKKFSHPRASGYRWTEMRLNKIADKKCVWSRKAASIGMISLTLTGAQDGRTLLT